MSLSYRAGRGYEDPNPDLCIGLRVQGFRFRGLGFLGLRFRFRGFGFRVWGLGFFRV